MATSNFVSTPVGASTSVPTDDGLRASGESAPTPAIRVRRWQRAFAALLVVTDAISVLVTVALAHVLRLAPTHAFFEGRGFTHREVFVGYSLVSLLVVVGWLASLAIFDTRESRLFGIGTDEYKRIVNATVAFFSFAAMLAFLFKAPMGRGYLLLSLPIGVVLLLASRWAMRKWLRSRRVRGRLMRHAVVVGDRLSARHVAEQIRRSVAVGIKIVGAVTAKGTVSEPLTEGVPVLGEWNELLSHVDRVRADTVIVTGNHSLTPKQLRELGWGLEERHATLIVAPALTDVAGPRIHTRPVAGLPLIHVDYPELTRLDRLLKRILDVVGASALMIIASPIMLAVAIAVKTTSHGPLFYGQVRVGQRGRLFKMWKFRSMVAGADDQLKSLLDEQGTSDRPLFKIQNDPRITPVGRLIRRYSLDELPQFFNVLNGSMSLVGPRPQVEAEVALYEGGARRRLLMRPGISGLWQVSGRSDLEWDDAIRLDLYYVENWSLMGDIIILWRTLKAVIAKEGAY